MNDWLIAVVAFMVGALVCRVVTARALRDPPQRLVRMNVDGRAVPAVLGWAVTAGVVAGHVAWAVIEYIDYLGANRHSICDPPKGGACLDALILVVYPWRLFVGLLVLSLGMFAVGLWDDFKGDERPRGFAGHIASLRQARWTGGLVKLVGGSATAVAALLLIEGGSSDFVDILLIAACVALSANLVNLLDRAPGRAAKVVLLLGFPLVLFGQAGSNLLLAGAIGALVVALPLDLKAKGMLGDAGANPLGALVGLVVVLNLGSEWKAWSMLGALLALNLASEKVSFSQVIAKNRVLARLDHLGRE